MSKDIFKGIERSEIENLGKRLSLEREDDNRFAAIQDKGDRLEITFYKTAFEACQYILMAPIENGHYNIRSLSLLEDDVKRILEGKIIEQQVEVKKSKDLDLER